MIVCFLGFDMLISSFITFSTLLMALFLGGLLGSHVPTKCYSGYAVTVAGGSLLGGVSSLF